MVAQTSRLRRGISGVASQRWPLRLAVPAMYTQRARKGEAIRLAEPLHAAACLACKIGLLPHGFSAALITVSRVV